jgi:hypothetical protein
MMKTHYSTAEPEGMCNFFVADAMKIEQHDNTLFADILLAATRLALKEKPSIMADQETLALLGEKIIGMLNVIPLSLNIGKMIEKFVDAIRETEVSL